MKTSQRQQLRESFIRGEVRDILTMFSAIKKVYDSSADKAGVNELWVKFLGFDGNNEYEHLHCMGQVCCGRSWGNLGHIGEMNSHMPYLRQYQRMVSEWKHSANPQELTQADLIRITRVTMA
jgi:uncharacterized protein YfbU (UPF0304 family)